MQHSILIIGGLGFIGEKLVWRLIEQNTNSVTIIDKAEKISSSSFSKKEVQHVDVNSDCTKVMFEAEIVIDLSYSTNPMSSFESPTNDIISNLPRSVSLFELLSKSNRLKKLIVISSGGTVYGDQQNFPISESAVTNPLSPYGITKLAIEKYALMYNEISQLPVIILRPSNAYGPGQMPFLGQGFISTAIANILSKNPISVYGKEGTIRDYVYISDLIGAIEHAIYNGKIAEIYNVGSGIGHSNFDIISRLKEMLDQQVVIDHKPARSFDVKKNILSSEKLERDTGWEPSVSINKGLAEMIMWVKNLNLLK